jgi:FlaA1/EpsC-like NDP-sugar epimerase
MKASKSNQAKNILRSLFFVLMDFIGLAVSLYLSYFLRYDFSLSFYEINIVYNITFLLIAICFKIIIFYCFQLYKSLWRYAGAYEVVKVVIASAIANSVLTLILIIQYQITGELFAPRSIFAITFMIDVFAVGGVRLFYRVYRRLAAGITLDLDKIKRVLIIGAGSAGAAIAKEMKKNPRLRSKPVAFVEKDPGKIGYKLNGIKVLDEKEQLTNIVNRERIDEIIIALPHEKATRLNEIYAEASKTGCKVKIIPSISQILDESVVMQKVKDVEIEDLLGRESIDLNTEEIEAFIKGRKILVTGAGGSIGSELCRQIAAYSPEKLIMLDNYENNLHDIYLELCAKHHELVIDPIVANIREKNRIDAVFQRYKPDIVFHAAAHKHVPLMEYQPEEAIKNNVLGTWNVAHSADKAGVRRFVLISSDKAVNPTNVMGATKRIAEMIIQALNTKSKTEFVAVRFGNVLGSNGSVIPIFKKQIESGGPVTVTHPDVTRYFMTIPEASQLVIQAGAFANGGEIFILNMGQPIKILALAENMIRLSGLEPYEDIPIEFIGLRPGEKLFEELLLSEEGAEKTKNDKIYVVRPLYIDYPLLKRKILYIMSILDEGASNDVIRKNIKELVPTFAQDLQVG